MVVALCSWGHVFLTVQVAGTFFWEWSWTGPLSLVHRLAGRARLHTVCRKCLQPESCLGYTFVVSASHAIPPLATRRPLALSEYMAQDSAGRPGLPLSLTSSREGCTYVSGCFLPLTLKKHLIQWGSWCRKDWSWEVSSAFPKPGCILSLGPAVDCFPSPGLMSKEMPSITTNHQGLPYFSDGLGF